MVTVVTVVTVTTVVTALSAVTAVTTVTSEKKRNMSKLDSQEFSKIFENLKLLLLEKIVCCSCSRQALIRTTRKN
jgi:hypothetical protein